MMLLMLLTGMMYRSNQKDIFWWNWMYHRAEGDRTSEPHHWISEGAMEAPLSIGSHLGIGKYM